MNYTLVSIWLGGLAAGCFLVAIDHPWFAVFVFVITFILSGMNTTGRRTETVISEPVAFPDSASKIASSTLNVSKPSGIM